MKQTYLKVVILIFVFVFGTIATAQGQHDHLNGKRIKISNPTPNQLTLIATSGIDLKCGAEIFGNDLVLELTDSQVEIIQQQNISFTTLVEDTHAFYKEQNEVELPKAKQKLNVLKSLSYSNNETRSLSTTGTTISNIIQYEGETEVNWQTPQNFELGSMNGCLTYGEMLTELDRMRQLYPNLISVRKDASLAEDGSGTPIKTHGNSFTNGGQYDSWDPQTIYYVRISDNPNTDESNEPESFYSGMSHAREASSMMNLIYYMWYVLENYETDADIKNLVDNHEMYFIPVANPDGLLWNEQLAPNGGGFQRKNLNPDANTGVNFRRGVDLNRNYDYFWGSNTAYTGNGVGSNNDPTTDVYRGTTAFSEPETRITKAFVANHDSKTALNHHATSNLLPHGYNAYPGSPASGREDDYVKFCHDLTRFNRYVYGEAPNVLTVANGDMSDWMLGGDPDPLNGGSVGSGKGILALAPENGNALGEEADPQFSSGFWPSPSQIVIIAARATRMNLVNALFAGKLAQLHDETPSNITATSGNLNFGVEYLGMTLSPLTLTVTPVSTNITSIGTTTTINLAKQEQTDIVIPYQLGTISPGDTIEYEVTLSNDTHIIYQATIQKTYQPSELFIDDVNPTSISNWTSSGSGTEWVTSATSGFGNSRGITFDATPPYANDRNVQLTLNQSFDISNLSSTTLIQFYAKWDLERNFDYAQLQGRDGNSGQWIPLSGKYTKPGSTLASMRYNPANGSGGIAKSTADRDNQPDNLPLFEGFKGNKWVLEEIEISPEANSFLAGASDLQLRFVFDSDSSNNADGYTTTFAGFSFDEFRVLNVATDRSCISGTTPVNHEDFEIGLGDWTQNLNDDGDLTHGSGSTATTGTGPSAASQGTYYFYTEASSNSIGVGSNAEVIITSPCIDWSGGLTGTFDFDYHMLGTNVGSLVAEVKLSNSSAWTQIFTRSGAQSTNGTDWKNATINLNAYSNEVFQIRFIITTGNGASSDIAIDNLRIDPTDTTDPIAICQNITVSLGYDGIVVLQPSQINDGSTDNIGIEIYSLDVDTFDCTNVGANTVTLTVTDFKGNIDTCTTTVTVVNDEAPLNLQASNIQATTATLNWIATPNNSYTVRFRESGTTTYTSINTTTNSLDLTGLEVGKTYEAQVKATCTAGGDSPYSAASTFTTQLTYCISEGSTDFANGITRVILGDIDQSSGPEPAYTDFTTEITTLSRGSSHNLTIHLNTIGSNSHTTTVWIDWNRNGDFTDTGESYDLGIDIDKANQPTDSSPFTIIVPIDAVLGNVRMRVSNKFNAPSTPCEIGFFGEVEDYTITIEAANYVYDAGAWSPQDPSGIATSNDNIEVRSGAPALSANTVVNNVTILAGATLDLAATTLDINGNITNSGAISGASGTILMTGSSPQEITGSDLEIANLVIDNSDTTQGVTLSTAVSVNKLLTLTDGTLNTGNSLTLLSNATRTAMIDVITGGNISGNVTTERYIPARRAFRLLSSPVTTTTSINANWQEGVNNTGTSFPTDNINPNPGYGTHISGSLTGANGFDATASGNGSIFKLDNASQSWQGVVNTDINTLTAGEPIRLLVRGDRSVNVTSNAATPTATTLRATGTIATSPVSVTGATLNHTAGAFNFIGNPYQASLNMNTVLSASTNVRTGEIWVWDATLGARGQYVTVLLDGSGSSNGANSKDYHYIQPGQAIFTATDATVADNSTEIIFNETDKVPGNEVPLYSNTSNTIATSPHLIGRLYRSEHYGEEIGLQDNFVILYSDVYSNDVTSEDVSKFFNIDENMGVLKDGGLLSIDKVAMPTEDDQIQLYNALYRTNNYTLDLDIYGLNEVETFIKDNHTGDTTLLEEGLNTISFTVDNNVETSVDTNRFEIIYQREVLSTTNEEVIDFAMYPNPITNGTLTITSTALSGSDVNLVITNILGQTVMIKETSFRGNKTVIHDLDQLSSGMYILSIAGENLKVSHKIVIQ